MVGRWLAVVVLAVTTAACASGGAVPRPFPTATPPDAAEPAALPAPAAGIAGAAFGHRVAATALEYRGVPYVNGGTSPAGFDCSGLVRYVLGRHGRPMPRLTRDQYSVGVSVARDALAAGDLVFFSTVAPGASHVGIALDDDEFVHAPSRAGVVRVERLTAPYWRSRFVGARRIR
jgi:cell wall-associated NlpC family hydrolase